MVFKNPQTDDPSTNKITADARTDMRFDGMKVRETQRTFQNPILSGFHPDPVRALPGRLHGRSIHHSKPFSVWCFCMGATTQNGGVWPGQSICRAGEDYYLITSSVRALSSLGAFKRPS